tara:strand:- start:53 stop:547 length:495 start_codon:yes stop_codon:yes gene_type:complete
MKKLILLFIVGSLFAQYLPPQSDIAKMSSTEKLMLYNMNKKSPALGVVYGMIVPTLGHAYANNWKRGIIINGTKLGSYILYVIYWDKAVWDEEGKEDEYYRKSELFSNIFLLTVIFDVIDSGFESNRYNKNLYRTIFGEEPPSFSLNLQPTYQGATLTMSYAFN